MSTEYILTSKGELIHADTSRLRYIDLDENELAHWKYVKKKKLPNGKWRYYYDIDQAIDDRLDKQIAKSQQRINQIDKDIKTYEKSRSSGLMTNYDRAKINEQVSSWKKEKSRLQDRMVVQAVTAAQTKEKIKKRSRMA